MARILGIELQNNQRIDFALTSIYGVGHTLAKKIAESTKIPAEKRVKELSHGQVNFKTESDQPLIHLSVGKVSFEDKKLMENVAAVLKTVGTNKISRASLSATMGPGIKLEIA